MLKTNSKKARENIRAYTANGLTALKMQLLTPFPQIITSLGSGGIDQ